ncbi:MAG TPA: CRTAC1 family protein [Terracidiphilus sp.]
MKPVITRRNFVAGLTAVSAGALNSRALQVARASSESARLDSGRLPAQYFETWSAEKTGIGWKHDNALSPERYLPESMGPGVAIFDYDNDGWMDLYFVNSGPADFFQPAKALRNALYRNNRDGTFTDVTEKAGVAGRDFGIGVAAADYDGDGWTDLLVTTYGRLILYRNNHDGTFTDVTKAAGLDEPGLFTSAVWFDSDNNGLLDLFVCHFAKYSKLLEHDCGTNGVRHYCYPKTYEPWPSRLYKNNGNGTFADISVSSGIAKHSGKAFGVVATDINNDGLLDLFVANDSVANFLYLNKGGGKFEEIGFQAGVAYSADGAARSGMGVDAIDFDGDGRQDLLVANISRERDSLYRNAGDNTFVDIAGRTGIGMATVMDTGWGARFADFDLDGRPDLILANGHPDDLIESINNSLHYREPLLLFHNNGNGFDNVSAAGGPAFKESYAARGLAVGDLDNDGHVDVVVGTNGGPPLILHNIVRNGNHWIGLNLTGLSVGARITWSANGVEHGIFKRGGGSYLSSCDPRDVLGLGTAEYADWIQVQWPAAIGRTDRFQHVLAGKYYSLAPGGKLL